MQIILPNSAGKISDAKRSPPTESTKYIVRSGNFRSTRLEPQVTNEMLKSKLFPAFDDITITQLLTQHPIYVLFHVQGT